MSRRIVLASLILLAGCKPPAADEYIARTKLDARSGGPSEPIASPDVKGAIWAAGKTEERLIYGKPGERPLMALECELPAQGGLREIGYTRYALADPHAHAILALIGNGHVERLKIDAAQTGDLWLWQGAVPADDPQLEVLTGPRRVEATVPGAGSLILNASRLPRDFIEACAAQKAAEKPDDPQPGPSPAPEMPADSV